MKAHNGSAARDQWKPPPGYVSAKARAYAKWKEANGKKLNMLTTGDAEDDEPNTDDESDDGFKICALKTNRPAKPKTIVQPVPPVTTKNSFEAFDDADMEEDHIAALGRWAHKVTTSKKPQSEAKKVKVITNQRELRKFMTSNPNVAQLPVERKKLSKVMKMVTKSVELADGETLVLMDSGSAINVAKIKSHFKQYANFIVPSSGSISGETATTACGKQLVNRGKCTVHGTTDGQKNSIPFQDMDVELPIISVQKCVKSGHSVTFHEDGGEMKNRSTGKLVKIHEIDGVYYIKMKIDDVPHDQRKSSIDKTCNVQCHGKWTS